MKSSLNLLLRSSDPPAFWGCNSFPSARNLVTLSANRDRKKQKSPPPFFLIFLPKYTGRRILQKKRHFCKKCPFEPQNVRFFARPLSNTARNDQSRMRAKRKFENERRQAHKKGHFFFVLFFAALSKISIFLQKKIFLIFFYFFFDFFLIFFCHFFAKIGD